MAFEARQWAAAGIPGRDRPQQRGRRIAARDDVVVDDEEPEPVRIGDRLESERHVRALARKRPHERPLDRGPQRLLEVRRRRSHLELDLRRSAAPREPPSRRVERVPGEPGLLERGGERRPEARGVELVRHARDVRRVVRMARAPTQHRRLEQVERALHLNPPAGRARSRAAPRRTMPA
jgi:hypothetical protein